MPEFGAMRMMDILPEHVRLDQEHMKKGNVCTPPPSRYNKVVLGTIFPPPP